MEEKNKEDKLARINSTLTELLGPKSGLFGRINSYGQIAKDDEYIGYELSQDFLPTLRRLSPEQRKTLSIVMIYFEIHMRPLRKLLDREGESEQLYNLYSEIAWSHFATLVMFGMAEVAIAGKRGVRLKEKGGKIKQFFEDNLPAEQKVDVVNRFSVDDLYKKEEITDFSSVLDHMWKEVRGGFVHEASVQYRGMEWSTIIGLGTRDNPIRIKYDVPMQEWLQLTWEATLHSFGYEGKLILPNIKYVSKTHSNRSAT